MDWNHVRAFLETVERGSLTGAARALNLTQPTVGRQIAALEERLGVLLFDRIGKSLSLTPGGLDLLEHARVMGKAIADLQIAATGQATSVEGRVSITASDLVCPYLATFLHDLKALAPGIEVHIVAANELRDIRRREADIAIRHVRPDQPELIARAMPSRTAHLYAAQRRALSEIIASGPIPAVHGVVRWRLIDLAQWIFEEFRIRIAKQTLSQPVRVTASALPRVVTPAQAAPVMYMRAPDFIPD